MKWVDDDKITDIIAQFESERDAGQEPSLSELCDGDSSLISAVRETLDVLVHVDKFIKPASSNLVASQCPLPPGYENLGILGEGAMGKVYKARDKSGAVLAIKTLSSLDPLRLVYLKREFTLLKNIHHENLIRIYEQIAEGSNWFCLMEYVEGEHLLKYIAMDPHCPDQHLPKIKPVFLQLAKAIVALHQSKRIHRDIKSTNVLVTNQGLVKLIDFGLIADMEAPFERQSGVVGTLDYMAPEQFDNRDLTPASDWYSFGILLYQALCGRSPFPSNIPASIKAKEAGLFKNPSNYLRNIPSSLESLCLDLLHTDPNARPDGEKIIRLLGGVVEKPPSFCRTYPDQIGRKSHHNRLMQDAARVQETGAPILTLVYGPSGIGKSTVVSDFLKAVNKNKKTVVLTGTCYEQSSVPYKALDAVIDCLLGYLRSLPVENLAAVLPSRMDDLIRMFPVLGRLAINHDSRLRVCRDDPHEARRRGYQSLRELLLRIASRSPLFVFADDVHWGDKESAFLLEALLQGPDAPPIHFIMAYRNSGTQKNSFLRRLDDLKIEKSHLNIPRLTNEETFDLTRKLWGPDFPDQTHLVEQIVRESDGNPLLVHELVAYKCGNHASTFPPTLESLVRSRFVTLESTEQKLVAVVCLSPEPIELESACSAALLPAECRRAGLDHLASNRLIRTLAGPGVETFAEPFHDKVRSTVIAEITAETRIQIHQHLAEILSKCPEKPWELLAHHYEHSGNTTTAIDHYAKAAVRSADALAFERASEQNKQALNLCDPSDPRREALLIARANNLANSAQSKEAAAHYLEAASLSKGPNSLFCMQQAAEQLIRLGKIDEGFAILRQVFQSAGVRIPIGPANLARSFRWIRFRLWLTGFKFRKKPTEKIPSEVRLRIEICRWAASLTRLFDVTLAAWFHTLGLIESWKAGDPFGVAFAMGREMYIPRLFGGDPLRYIESTYLKAQDFINQIDNLNEKKLTRAMLHLYRGIGYYLTAGDAKLSLKELQIALQAFNLCSGPSVASQRMTLRMMEGFCLLTLGEIAQFRELVAESTRGMLEKGNLHAAVTLPLLTRSHQIQLADDQPEEALSFISQSISMWSKSSFFLQHFWADWGKTEVLLYQGKYFEAYQVNGNWLPHLKINKHFDSLTKSFAIWTEARTLVGYASSLPKDEQKQKYSLLKKAKKLAMGLTHLPEPKNALPQGWTIQAACHYQQGNEKEACAYLAKAEQAYDQLGMVLSSASVLIHHGIIKGETKDKAMAQSGLQALKSKGVRNPLKFSTVYMPGFQL
jgi:serine/threonine protein kinase/tetratricopeptide (TPR) repeat protein